MNTRNLYIEILSFGEKNLGAPIEYLDLISHLKETGIEYDEFSVQHFFSLLFISKTRPQGHPPGHVSSNGMYFLGHEGYFNLLEFQELKEARDSSRSAKNLAVFAILFSGVLSVASIYFSYKQLNSPISINAKQIQELNNTEINTDLEEIINLQQEAIKQRGDINNQLKLQIEHNKQRNSDSGAVAPSPVR